MNVRELMTTDVVTVAPETPLKDVAALLARDGISGLPVCDADGNVLGVVSEGTSSSRSRGRRIAVGGRSRGCSIRTRSHSRRATPAPPARR